MKKECFHDFRGSLLCQVCFGGDDVNEEQYDMYNQEDRNEIQQLKSDIYRLEANVYGLEKELSEKQYIIDYLSATLEDIEDLVRQAQKKL